MLSFVIMMQIFGCVLVVFGHSYPFVTDIPQWLIHIRTYIYSFHMPLFVWCSGFLLVYTKQSERYSFVDFALRRAKRILIPYFVLSLVGIVPKYFMSAYLNDSLGVDVLSLVKTFLVPRFNIWGHFWFLPMIFLICLIGYGVDKLHIKAEIKWVGALILGITLSSVSLTDWFGLNDILLYFWFFAFGALTALIKPERIRGKLSIGISLLFVSIVAFLLEIRYKFLDWAFLKKIIAILVIYGVMYICVSVSEKFKIEKSSLMAETYSWFILAWPLQLLTEVVLERILHLPISIEMPCVVVVGLVFPIAVIKLIRVFEMKTNTHFVSFILGAK